VHVDAGDFKNGYSVVMVAEEGKYKGGYLGFPRFGVCVDLRHGDFLLIDPHQHHANTEIIPVTEDYTRLSFVVYYRENMQKCAMQPQQGWDTTPNPSPKLKPVIKKKPRQDPVSLELVPAIFPKRDVNVNVYIRPETTDIKVIDEVLKQNVYEKRFKIEASDKWLDLGGNIGTFALLALSRGAEVVTCEPESENLYILNKNLTHNFPNGRWNIIPAAITVEEKDTLDLYLCKGDYNKYRHTIFPKRGRSTVKVQNTNIRKLLAEGKFNGIKIDIEGAEIPILESLTEHDYTGIHKMVFEYSFDVDDSIPRFMNIIRKLSKVFTTVYYTKVKPDELHYTYFPAMTIVYCSR
jgi:FkbM family methyltransferase